MLLAEMKTLEAIDATILRELLRDGRKSFADISKECEVSENLVWKRYLKMKNSGIVVGATSQVYFEKIGYDGVATIQLNIESQGIEEVYADVCKIPDVYMFRQYNGHFNAGSIVRLKSLRDLERLKAAICRNNLVNEVKTHLWTDVRNIPENIIAGSFETKTILPENIPENEMGKRDDIEIDELDKQIIDKLTRNGRVSFRKLSVELGTSTGTIARRYAELKKNNILKISIQIDPSKLGYQAILDVSIMLAAQNEINEIVDQLSKIPGVSYIIKITGDYDLQVIALVKDSRDIISINDKIVKIPHIKRIAALLRNFRPGYEVWPSQGQHISTF